ncbi:unnamed protein product [Lymnaea stagnalis]|uniref:Uncharacterized protein n=1 Tax=Lymnaea stagnalis TaxID=6523 RepID=A0AAV2HPP2_LYMST
MFYPSQQHLNDAFGTGLDPVTFMLLRVAEHGFTTEAEYVIKKGADVNDFNMRTGKTALVLASENGHNETARLLMKYGACVEGKYSCLSPVALAAVNGHIETVALLIEHGANLNKTDLFDDKSVLNIASEKGYNDMVKMLLKNGANVNDESCEASLMYAVRNGHTDVAETLIDGGADIDYKCPKGFSVLETSLMCGQQDIAKLLIERGAKLDGALMRAIACKFTDVVHILINKDVNEKDTCGKTMLIIAATCGETELVTTLIEKGSDVDEKDDNGMTPLMYASNKGFKNVVEKLIEHGACINESCQQGMTALMYASQTGCTDVVTLLIDNGANLNMKAMNGDTALIFATINEHSKTVEVLIDKGADVHILGKNGMSARQIAIINISNKEILNIFIQKRCLVSKNITKGQISINKPMDTPGKETNSPGQDTNTSGQETNNSVKDTNTPGQDIHTTGQDTNTSGQETNNSVKDSHTSEQDTNTTGQEMNTTGQDTNTSGQVTNNSRQDTNTPGQEMNTTGQDTNTSRQDTNNSRQDTNTTGQDTNTPGQDTNTPGQDTNTPGQDTNTPRQEINTTGQDTDTIGQDSNIFREIISINQSVDSDCKKVHSLSIDIQQQTKLDGNKKKGLSEGTIANHETTDPLIKENEEMPLCETHLKHTVPSRKRRRTNLKRCQALNKEAPCPEVAICHGSKVSSLQGSLIHRAKVSSSKDAIIHGSVVSSNKSRGDDKRQAAESQTLLIQSAGPCTDSDSYDTVSTDTTAEALEAIPVTECTRITGAASPAITDYINPYYTESSRIPLKTAEMVLDESITRSNFKTKQSMHDTSDDRAIQHDDEWPECTSSDMDKFLMQLEEFLSDLKQETVNTGPLQDTSKKYLPQQNPIIFKLYHIDRVDHAHLQNPLYVNITDTTYCVIDEKT